MVSRDRRDPLVYNAPKSKETRNKILSQVTKVSKKRNKELKILARDNLHVRV